MLKRELKKFLISFLITSCVEIYLFSNLLRNSLWDAVVGTFTYDLSILPFVIGFYLTAYLLFNFFYLIVSFINKKRQTRISPVKATTILLVSLFFLFVVNDQLIIYDLKDYSNSWRRCYVLKNPTGVAVTTENYKEFEWMRESFDFLDDEYLVKERLLFYDDNKMLLTGSLIVTDRFYLVRKLLDIRDYYTVEEYDSVEIKDNKLYLHFVDEWKVISE